MGCGIHCARRCGTYIYQSDSWRDRSLYMACVHYILLLFPGVVRALHHLVSLPSCIESAERSSLDRSLRLSNLVLAHSSRLVVRW